MRTTKPIATISFNTPEYLFLKLDELVSSGHISFWSACVHKPEDDEGGKKQHTHVYLEPSKMIQTDSLVDFLKEPDPAKPNKPKGCLRFGSSKFDHWYLYAIHDKRYLASKGQSRKFHYSFSDIATSSDEDLLYKVKSIDLLSISPYFDMLDAIEHGITWAEYFRRGSIPIQQLNQWQKAWELLTCNEINRNGRKGHENE